MEQSRNEREFKNLMYDESGKDVNDNDNILETPQQTKDSFFFISISNEYKDRETTRND